MLFDREATANAFPHQTLPITQELGHQGSEIPLCLGKAITCTEDPRHSGFPRRFSLSVAMIFFLQSVLPSGPAISKLLLSLIYRVPNGMAQPVWVRP